MRATAAGETAASHRPPSLAEALLRREVVDVDLAGVEAQPAGARRRVDEHELVGAGAVGPDRPAASRRSTSRCGASSTRRRRRRRAGSDGCPAGSRSPRGPRGGAPPRGRRELRRELAADEVLAARARSARRWPRPRSWWCRRCRAAPRSRRGARRARRGPARTRPDHRLHRRLAVARPEVVAGPGRPARRRPRRGPSTGPDPKRPSDGQELGREDDGAWVAAMPPSLRVDRGRTSGRSGRRRRRRRRPGSRRTTRAGGPAPTSVLTVPPTMPGERLAVAQRHHDVTEDAEAHEQREPTVHEVGAGADVGGEGLCSTS